MQLGEPPSWTKSSSANGQVGSHTDSARRFAELDRTRIQLGHSPSWIARGFSSAVRRAGSHMDSARPFADLDRPESVFTSSS
ncbi:hypothetical protein DY000_02016621 [Brassica cretica]|uniref:Uncharacterized protein n=1 Tax=Brassica cretica TaxID=69181 RepID=A0ABQ7DAD6_BRACR|nr:hypothetical protein DY000_02016621 [Brassica cretica]